MAFNMSLYDHIAFVNDNNIFKSLLSKLHAQKLVQDYSRKTKEKRQIVNL